MTTKLMIDDILEAGRKREDGGGPDPERVSGRWSEGSGGFVWWERIVYLGGRRTDLRLIIGLSRRCSLVCRLVVDGI